jgi:hypothetical protein
MDNVSSRRPVLAGRGAATTGSAGRSTASPPSGSAVPSIGNLPV